MTQWKSGEMFYGKETDTTGVAHYFNIGYKFQNRKSILKYYKKVVL